MNLINQIVNVAILLGFAIADPIICLVQPSFSFESIPTKIPAKASIKAELESNTGLNFRKTSVSLPDKDGKFLIFNLQILQLNLKQSGLQMRPILANANQLTGTSTLKTMATTQGAIAAINGGFFHIPRQMPLGAIKVDNRWLSGSVLFRGAIAWNDRGEILIDRLNYQEQIIFPNQSSISITNLNSGYVQKGVARYNLNWGANYMPLTDNEVVMAVQQTTQGDRLVAQSLGGEAAKNSFVIPVDGYLLVARQAESAVAQLSNSAFFSLQSQTTPDQFNSYSQLLAAGPLLLKNSEIVLDPKLEGFQAAFTTQKAIRSAIATTAKPGEIIMVTIQANSGSLPNLQQTAQILQKLGAVSGLNLDGGGSTSFFPDHSESSNSRPIHNGIGIFRQ